jgi:hypothetical protein
LLAVAGIGAIAVAALSSPIAAGANSLGYTIHQIETSNGGEPSITAAGISPTLSSPGELYEASLSAAAAFRSTNQGVLWTRGATDAFSNTGDDCLATDQVGALYLCNLTIVGPSTSPLNGDVYKSVDQGNHWTHSTGVMFGSNTACAVQSTSCNPLGVDRDWVDAYIPPGGSTTNAEVVLMYHDFYGPSHIWVNISLDGGATFGGAEDILTHLNPSVSAGISVADTACSTVPSAVKIAKGGPHPGRVYVAWIAADPSSTVTGCNLSQAQAFHNLLVAWTDPPTAGGTIPATPMWNAQLAFDGGPLHDASSPFASFTLDNQGNPYFAFTMNHWDSNPVTNQSNIQTCAGLSSTGMLQGHPECEYDAYVVWSADGGPTWDGGGGTIAGSAAAPYLVNNPATEPGNHQFAAMDATSPGHVDFAYLRTPTIEPINNSGKYDPGGCAGPGPANGNPTTYPPPCEYDLYAAQSSSLTSPPSTSGLWTIDNLTSPTSPTATPMHVGDICNLGIACTASLAADRSLADFIMMAIDPTTGCAHIAFVDNATANATQSADQTGPACFALLGTNVPETPLTPLFAPIAVAAVAVVGWVARRRRKAAPEI